MMIDYKISRHKSNGTKATVFPCKNFSNSSIKCCDIFNHLLNKINKNIVK